MYANSASRPAFGDAKQKREQQEEEHRKRQEEEDRRRQEEEERKRREEERKHRKRESDHNSDEGSTKKAKTERGELASSNGNSSTSQSLVINGGGDGGGSFTDQSKTNSRLQHLKDSSLPLIRNLSTELDGVVHPKSKMVEGVKELIKMDLTMEEGIGMAINVLDNSLKYCYNSEELAKMVIYAVSKAKLAQLAMKRAKEEQNKLRFALVDLLFSSLE